MKTPIVRLYALVIVLFAVLIGFTSRWAVFEAEALRDNPANRRALLQEERIKRGAIRTADGKLVAGSQALPGKRYRRRYPTGGRLLLHVDRACGAGEAVQRSSHRPADGARVGVRLAAEQGPHGR
jgi:peptidoglycan glycosyltransferase